MSSQVTQEKWIFVNYVPGSFGSFLTKAIETSPDVFSSTKNSLIFNEYNASHENVMPWIKKWHDGDELYHWLSLDHESKVDYLYQNINHDLVNRYPDMFKVHRLTMPLYHTQFKNYWEKSKFIVISLDRKLLDFVCEQMSSKTFHTWKNKINKQNADLWKILQKVDINHQKKYYKKLCESRIRQTCVYTSFSDCYDFPITDFFAKDTFLNSMDKLFTWLGIQKGETGNLFNQFYQLNQFDR